MKAVIFGAGAVGLGFLGELLSKSGWRTTFADIDSDLAAAINSQSCYIFNKVSTSVEQVEVGPASVIDLRAPDADGQLDAALAQADLVFTAAGARAFAPVGRSLARAAESAAFPREPLNVLCCENHHDAAAALAATTQEALGEPASLATKFALVNTVVARMCQRLTPTDRDLPPVAPGVDTVILTESYALLPADASAAAPPVPEFAGLKFLSGPEFAAWDHRKLFAHNGTHALLGVLGKLAGYTYMYECRRDADINAAARRALREEVGDALLRAYPKVFTPTDHDTFAEDLYARITSDLFADSVDRGTRNTMRMISPEDGRLSGAAEFVLRQGGQPRALALAIAGVLLLNGKPPDEATDLLAHTDPSVRAEQIALTEEALSVIVDWQGGAAQGLRSFVQ